VIIYNDIIDVCIDNRRCIVNRLGEKQGADLWLYARDGKLAFSDLKVNPIK
jgi:beta-fructofuranosidase